MARRAIPLVFGAFAIVVTLTFLLIRDEGSPSDDMPFALQQLLLELDDLEPGFQAGDDTGCGAISPEGRSPELAAVLGNTFPPFCVNQFESDGVLTPPMIESAVVLLPTPELASALMTAPGAATQYFFGLNRPVGAPEQVGFGDEAVLIDSQDVNSGGGGLLFAWRDGSHVHFLGFIGPRARIDHRGYMSHLADIQQSRSEDR